VNLGGARQELPTAHMIALANISRYIALGNILFEIGELRLSNSTFTLKDLA
jgi:hypothetical protein